jgi:hypothetical protein
MSPRAKRVALFYAVTFGLTHALSLAYVGAGGSFRGPRAFAVANLLMLCPAVVALGVQRFALRRPVVAPLGLRLPSVRWFVVVRLFPTAVNLAALAIALGVPGASYAPDMGGLPPDMDGFRQQIAGLGLPPFVGLLALGLALGPTLNSIGGLGEEIGWRGFVDQELSPTGFWRCSLATGALWAAWHVPVFLEGYGDPVYPVANALGMLAFAMTLAPVLHFVRQRSGSVVACGILHGTMGSTRLLGVAFVRDAGPALHAAIPLALLAVDVALAYVVARRPVLAARSA